MKKLVKLIYLIFTAFLFTCTSTNEINKNRIEKIEGSGDENGQYKNKGKEK